MHKIHAPALIDVSETANFSLLSRLIRRLIQDHGRYDKHAYGYKAVRVHFLDIKSTA